MEITGYKYNTEVEAQVARQLCNNHYGIPLTPDSVTKHWIDYNHASLNTPDFWYITENETISDILGQTETFIVEQPEVNK
jgi:hypothetical protein